MNLLLSCEHYGNLIPPAFEFLFENEKLVLETHRGHDIKAQIVFDGLKNLTPHHFFYPYSRLLIEANRSEHHPLLFSDWSKKLTNEQKEILLFDFYRPYRKKVQDRIAIEIKEGQTVTHISVHSFTPILNGQKRLADIGLLYDPTRKNEKAIARFFKIRMNEVRPSLKVRFNYPYLGTADGFTTHLRRLFPNHYAGIELEVKNDIIDSELINDIYTVLSDLTT